MIAVVDYGVGNLYSLTCSLRHIGAQCTVTREENALRAADRIILPGVGAFGDAAEKLHALRLDALLRDLAGQGKPLMGICLGMQLLFDKSYEYGEHRGLGLIPGNVKPIEPVIPQGLKIPHIGWNALHILRDDQLFQYIQEGEYVYYVHSYYGRHCTASTLAVSDYSIPVTGVVRAGKVYGTQFHPEKSGDTGLRILKAFSEL